MVKIKAIFGFSHQFLLTLPRVRGKRDKKKYDFVTTFFIFKFLGLSEI